jgi:hypothetical protein
VDASSHLLALRLGGQDHALEPGRDYLLGSAADCDFRLPLLPPHAARLCVQADGAFVQSLAAGATHNGNGLDAVLVVPGDVLRFADGRCEAVVVPDDGNAAIVPIPSLQAAAKARRLGAAARAVLVARRQEGETLQELLANELRRAPWLTLSLVAHALLLLLLWWWLPLRPPSGDQHAAVNLDFAGELPGPLDGPPTTPEVDSEADVVTFDPPAVPEPPVPENVAALAQDGPRPPIQPSPQLAQQRIARRIPVASGGRGTGDTAGTIGSGGFRRTVSELRKSGLEIVFVFDSTGSMTRMIDDTRSSISQMLAVLQALVPDARVGLVTFRDRGRNERYLVQQIPLGFDFWRAVNFMQFVVADGGGDRPEDVRAGLRAAFAQDWRPTARRVVVLAGDAPPHADDFTKLLGEVKAFAHDGRSFVHTLVASPRDAGQDTQQTFAAIAAAGNGISEDMDARDRVLQRVLTLAFGRDFDQDIAAVIRAAEEHSQQVDVQALDLVQRGGPELARALRQSPLPPSVWNALVRRPRRSVGVQLLELVADDSTKAPQRNAAAAALQRLLQLPLPPIDPITGDRPTRAAVERLRGAVAKLPE